MPLDTHQLAPWQLLKQQLLQLATAATASAAALRATCCDLVLTKNRLKKKTAERLWPKSKHKWPPFGSNCHCQIG